MSGLDIERTVFVALHGESEAYLFGDRSTSETRSMNDRAAHVAAVLREQIAAAQAEAWDQGYTSGHSNAMRRMSDEPSAPTTPNPYRAAQVACVDPSRSDGGSTDPEVRQSADRTSSPSRVPGEES